MLNIRLFCCAGMSTSLLMNAMKKAARDQGKEVDIQAFPIGEMDRHIENCDVVLLGPQVSYLKKKAEAIAMPAGIPLAVIPMADYGRCNGQAVLKTAETLAASR